MQQFLFCLNIIFQVGYVPVMYPNPIYANSISSSCKDNQPSAHAMVITKGDIKISFPSANSNDGGRGDDSDEVRRRANHIINHLFNFQELEDQIPTLMSTMQMATPLGLPMGVNAMGVPTFGMPTSGMPTFGMQGMPTFGMQGMPTFGMQGMSNMAMPTMQGFPTMALPTMQGMPAMAMQMPIPTMGMHTMAMPMAMPAMGLHTMVGSCQNPRSDRVRSRK